MAVSTLLALQNWDLSPPRKLCYLGIGGPGGPQTQYKGNHKRGGAAEGRVTSFVVAGAGRHLCILALNNVNIIAVTTILVLHVGNGRSEHVCLDITFRAIKVLIFDQNLQHHKIKF